MIPLTGFSYEIEVQEKVIRDEDATPFAEEGYSHNDIAASYQFTSIRRY